MVEAPLGRCRHLGGRSPDFKYKDFFISELGAHPPKLFPAAGKSG
jgi:hypothetical protein